MPTLKSVNVHPELCAKLATEVTPPITTPLSLLSRDAASTAQQLNVPLSLWNEVRLGVANAILKQSSTFPRGMKPAKRRKQEDMPGHDNAKDDDQAQLLIEGSISALEYWKHSQSLTKCIRSAASVLSPWLLSAPRGICQLTGPPGTGKTQLCLDMAVRRAQGRVLYVTTSAPPASLARRLRQLVFGTENPKQRLMNIDIVSVTTPYDLLSALRRVVNESSEAEQQNPLLLFVDSISGCLGGCNDWNLIQQVSLLMKQLVHWHGVEVVVTNGISSKGKAALGQVWNQVAEIQVRLEAGAAVGVMRAILESHPDAQLCGASKSFIIKSKSVESIEENRVLR